MTIYKKRNFLNIQQSFFATIYRKEKGANGRRSIYLFGAKVFSYKKKYHLNYTKVLKRIKKENKTVRVVFLISENQKWHYQELYDHFSADERFEPIILVSLLTSVHNGFDHTRNNLKENYEFFKARGMNVEYCYVNGQYQSLTDFSPDIVFYEQPWELPDEYMPYNVSKYALTFYEGYFYSGLFDSDVDQFTTPFYKSLYKFFLPNEATVISLNKKDKCFKRINVNIGYSKLDKYLDKFIPTNKVWKTENAFKIIYAPHHSFGTEHQNLATFQKNGKYILSLAKKHPETTWIFKPHPRFRYALLENKIMTEQEIEEYYNEWQNIGNVYTQGDYIDIFRSSDLLITDCCSFLAEYLFTEKPVIRLCNEHSDPLTKLGEDITSGYYHIYENNDIESTLEKLISHNDEKLNHRKALIEKYIDKNEKTASKIHQYISKIIFPEKKIKIRKINSKIKLLRGKNK